MAKLDNAFDSDQHDDMIGAFDPIPADDYLAHITASDIKQTKAKTGKYIKFEFTIIDGEYKGRKIWTNLNIINRNPVAVEIAQKELATLCRACGVAQVEDTQELHGIPFVMSVKIKPASGDFPAGNEPCGYAAVEGGEAPAPKATAAQKTGGVPWAKKK